LGKNLSSHPDKALLRNGAFLLCSTKYSCIDKIHEKIISLLSYHVIATVTANHSNTTTSYSIDDNNAIPGVVYYYRIRQADINGRISYSKTVSAQLQSESITVKLMPNPVKHDLQLKIMSDKQQQVSAILTDVSGKILYSEKFYLLAGGNIFYRDMSSYSNGTYFIRIIAADGSFSIKKFIVQKNFQVASLRWRRGDIYPPGFLSGSLLSESS